MKIFKKMTLISIISLNLVNNIYSINNKTVDKADRTSKKALTLAETDKDKLNIILKEIKAVLTNYENIEKEITTINLIKLKNFTGIGLLKHFKGQITFAELKALKSLEDNFNDQSSLQMFKYIFGLIIAKASSSSENEKQKNLTTVVGSDDLKIEKNLAILIRDIKDLINQHFNEFNLELKNSTIEIPNSLSIIFKHPIVKKIVEISKNDTEKLKAFLKYLFEKILPVNSSVKKSLNVIANEIDYLLYF